MLILKNEHIDAIICHAGEIYPHECCGIIAGKDARVESIIKIRNVVVSSVEYSMSTTELKGALDELDSKGLEFIGVYHSHPTSVAYPSETDVINAAFPELDYIIVSLLDRDNPELKNFKMIDKKIQEEPFEVID